MNESGTTVSQYECMSLGEVAKVKFSKGNGNGKTNGKPIVYLMRVGIWGYIKERCNVSEEDINKNVKGGLESAIHVSEGELAKQAPQFVIVIDSDGKPVKHTFIDRKVGDVYFATEEAKNYIGAAANNQQILAQLSTTNPGIKLVEIGRKDRTVLERNVPLHRYEATRGISGDIGSYINMITKDPLELLTSKEAATA